MKKKILVIFSCFLGLIAAQAQSPAGVKGDDPFFRWIAEMPGKQVKTGFFEKAFNLLTGTNPVEYKTPVNVIAYDTHNCLIVNQGDGTILNYHNGSTDMVPAFRKEHNRLPSLVGICRFSTDGILFTDSRMSNIYFLGNDFREYRKFNDSCRLDRPTGIAYSEATGEVWVVETGSHRISVFDRNGIRKRIIGRRGSKPAEFNYPTYIWIDRKGRVFIVDSMNFRIQVLSSAGEFITAFGQQGSVSGTFARPRGVATDSQGNIYVVDALANVVQIFDISGRFLYYFGSQGRGKYQFWMPSGIFIDGNDYIYVSDSYNSRIQVFQSVKNHPE